MTNRRTESPTGRDNEVVADAIFALSQELRVLRDVLDEIRENLVWGLRNDRLGGVDAGVVKQMAADPSGDDWSEKLQVVRSAAANVADQSEESSELQEAQTVIRELLACTELSLDDLAETTRAVIERAEAVTGAADTDTASTQPVPDSSPDDSPEPARLF